jgi:cyclase
MGFPFTLGCDLMACRIVDLSCDVTVHEKGPFETRIDVVEAADGARILCERVVGHIVPEAMGRLHADDFPDAAFLRHEMVSASAHRGHINDAPLEAFVGPGVTLDVTGIAGWQVELRHIKAAAEAGGVTDYGGAIVLIHTERDKAISAEVVEDLVDQGVRVIGTDADGFDGSFEKIIRRFLSTGDRATLWPAHMIGRRRPYYQIERLRNLEALPATGYFVMALPVLIEGATAAWTRAVAFVPRSTSADGQDA